MKIEIKIDVTDYQLDCVLCGAFEGGSNYWLDSIKVVNNDYKGAEFGSEVISKGGELLLSGESFNEKLLTKEKLLNGVKLYITDGNEPYKRYEKWVNNYLDGYDSDIILQYALFGDIVFG